MRRGEFLTALHLLRLGRLAEARAAAERSLVGSPLDDTRVRAWRVAILKASGAKDDFEAVISSLWPLGSARETNSNAAPTGA